MKLFYFGSVCDNTVFNDTVQKSRVKPSSSAQSFEYALISGFSENTNVEVTVVSAESIATYPNGNRIFLKKRRDILTDNITANIIPTFNLPILKQHFHAIGAVKQFKKWYKQNLCENKCVIMYGLYPTVAKKMLKVCKKNNCKIFNIVADIPETMFTYTKSKGIFKALLGGSYRKLAVNLQNKFDGYIYLTEAMAEKVAPGKPYIVIEAIADSNIFNNTRNMPKAYPPAIMYAGALYKKYGTDIVISAFERLKSNAELWLFGSGDYEEEIIKKANKNSKIKFFGRVPREEILIKEKEAMLLLNIRNSADNYTKYSFPSKMTEYMLSGTPLLTTKLSGIPDEYYNYVYSLDTREPNKIANRIDELLSNTAELQKIGVEAKRFVSEEKNEKKQANKIIDFLSENCIDESGIY